MTFKKIISAFAALSISVMCAVFSVTPASAVGPSASISPNTFPTSSTTAAFTVTVPSTGSAISNWMEIYVSFSNTSNVSWPVALNTCTMGAPQALSTCGIQSISIGGSTVSDAVVKKMGDMISISRPLIGQTQQFFTNNTSNEVIISVASGVFTTPGTAGTNYQASVMYNGQSAPSITPAAVSLTSASQTVTFNANGGSGTPVTQSASSQTALTSNSYTKAGFTFGGWASSQANANAGTVAYANGANYAFTSSTTLYAIWTANGSGGGGSSASANMTINASTGSLVAGSSVAIVASGLQASAPYTVTVQSTPQTIGTGTASSGSVNTSVTIPSGLEAGWHTLTFTSTAADGSAVESKLYFRISASGMLLESTSAIPAALANTGNNMATPLALAGGLVLGGFALMLIRRRLVK